VIPITIGSILEADARRAGYESRQALVEELNEQTDGKVYRIEGARSKPIRASRCENRCRTLMASTR